MLRTILRILTFSAMALPAMAPAATITAPGAALYAPHRAIYDIALAPSRNATGKNRLESARGRLVYEFMGSACEGWTTNIRFVTEMQPQEGEVTLSDIRSNTFESGKGDEFRFVTRSLVNNIVRDEADGTATRRPDDTVHVEITKPGRKILDMPPLALFPTQHVAAVLDAARRGETVVQADLFDGSEGGGKVFSTTSVIGRPISAPVAGHPTNIEAFRDMKRWPLTISFFERQAAGQGEQLPLYELSVEVYDNGVTHSMFLDYGDFALKGTMTSIEMLPATPCK